MKYSRMYRNIGFVKICANCRYCNSVPECKKYNMATDYNASCDIGWMRDNHQFRSYLKDYRRKELKKKINYKKR